jgi:hypothetical protein
MLSEDELLMSLLRKRREGRGGGGSSLTGTEEDDTTDFDGDMDEGVVFGDDAEREIKAAGMDVPKVATPMGLAGAEGQAD